MASRSTTVYVVSLVFSALASLFVFFRILSRGWVVKRVGLDDYFMILAWVLAFGLTFAICFGTSVGLGKHQDDVLDVWEHPLRKSIYAFSILYQPALMAVKTSILVFYLTLSQANRKFRWATIVTLAVVVCGGLALTTVTIFQCRPPDAAWMYPTPSTARCTDILTILLSSVPLNIITDIAILLLPLPVLTRMTLPRKQKRILVATFSFGIFVAVVDVIRVAYLQDAATARLLESKQGSTGSTLDSTDFSWYASYSFMWTAVEVNIGIVCACVPSIKPLVARFAPSLLHDGSDDITGRPSANDIAVMVDQQHISSLKLPQRNDRRRPANQQRSSNLMQSPQPLNRNDSLELMRFITTPETPHMPARPLHPGDSEDMMHFLTSRIMTNEFAPDEGTWRPGHSDTRLTNTTRDTPATSPRFFDFVDLRSTKSLVQLTGRESVLPVALVSVLFFISGFEYGLLFTLNQQFQKLGNFKPVQGTYTHVSYFAGYFVGPLVIGRPVLKLGGFKTCFITGLIIYATGSLIFWVSAVLNSLPAYIIVNFIVGVGLSVLETGANPFVALCGPLQYAEIRLNLSQGFQAIGAILSPLAARNFANFNTVSLVNTQWVYFGIALLTFGLAFVYYYIPLPEATDLQIEDASERLDSANDAKIGNVKVIWYILGLGVLSQFCYLGAQEVFSTTFFFAVTASAPAKSDAPVTAFSNYTAIADTGFAVSRFIAAGLCFFVKPRYVLLICYVGSLLSGLLHLYIRPSHTLGLSITTFFWEGPLFTLIYAQSLRGQGKHTKDASVLITAAMSGGAVFPIISFALISNERSSLQVWSAIAPLIVGLTLPLFLIFSPAARLIVDPVWPRKERQSDSGTSDRRDNQPHGLGLPNIPGRTSSIGKTVLGVLPHASPIGSIHSRISAQFDGSKAERRPRQDSLQPRLDG